VARKTEFCGGGDVKIVSAFVGFMALCAAGAANAESTGWMTEKRARNYPPFINKQEYATNIECRQGRTPSTVLLRFQTQRVDMDRKPFHKWQVVVSDTSGLDRSIAAIKLRDHPELKYRIVDQQTFMKSNGESVTCALLYRGTGPA